MEYTFREASTADIPRIMEIIGEAKRQMAREGKNQWDDAYPTRADIESDIAGGAARVMLAGTGRIVAYGAIALTGEPAYNDIRGRWLSDHPYAVLHRLAVAEETKGRGAGLLFIREAERIATSAGMGSFKIDTNHDNSRMLRLLEKAGFTFCGTIRYPLGSRMAFEKLLQ